jgi:hypothetical protein
MSFRKSRRRGPPHDSAAAGVANGITPACPGVPRRSRGRRRNDGLVEREREREGEREREKERERERERERESEALPFQAYGIESALERVARLAELSSVLSTRVR